MILHLAPSYHDERRLGLRELASQRTEELALALIEARRRLAARQPALPEEARPARPAPLPGDGRLPASTAPGAVQLGH